jgi:hypothetical protein
MFLETHSGNFTLPLILPLRQEAAAEPLAAKYLNERNQLVCKAEKASKEWLKAMLGEDYTGKTCNFEDESESYMDSDSDEEYAGGKLVSRGDPKPFIPDNVPHHVSVENEKSRDDSSNTVNVLKRSSDENEAEGSCSTSTAKTSGGVNKGMLPSAGSDKLRWEKVQKRIGRRKYTRRLSDENTHESIPVIDTSKEVSAGLRQLLQIQYLGLAPCILEYLGLNLEVENLEKKVEYLDQLYDAKKHQYKKEIERLEHEKSRVRKPNKLAQTVTNINSHDERPMPTNSSSNRDKKRKAQPMKIPHDIPKRMKLKYQPPGYFMKTESYYSMENENIVMDDKKCILLEVNKEEKQRLWKFGVSGRYFTKQKLQELYIARERSEVLSGELTQARTCEKKLLITEIN